MIRPISEGDAWVTNEDGDIIGIQLHGRSEVVDLSNPVNGKVDLVTGGIVILSSGKSGVVPVTVLVGDGVNSDHASFSASISAAGVDGTIALVPGATYITDRKITLLDGQRIDGNGATIKRADQVTSQTTSAVTKGVTNSILVRAGDGSKFSVGQQIVLVNGASYETAAHVITSISGDTLVIAGTFGASVTGTTSVYTAFCTLEITDGCSIDSLRFDGNRSHWEWAHWETVQEVCNYGSMATVTGCVFNDAPGEGVIESGSTILNQKIGCEYNHNRFNNLGGNAMHFSGSRGSQFARNTVRNCNQDLTVGHAGGGVTLSDYCMYVDVSNNYIYGCYGGVGQIDSWSNSYARIVGNVIANCSTDGIYAKAGNANSAAVGLIIEGNKLINSGSITVGNTTAAASASCTGTLTVGSSTITGISSMSGIRDGAFLSGTGVPANAVVGWCDATTNTVIMTDVYGDELVATASGSVSISVSGRAPWGSIIRGNIVTNSGIGNNVGAIQLQRNSGITVCDNIVKFNADDTVSFGIYLGAENSNYSICGNTVEYGNNGIRGQTSGGDGVLIDHNILVNQYADGINMRNNASYTGSTISNNIIRQSLTGSSLVGITPGSGQSVTGNSVHFSGTGYRRGIRVNASANNVVKNNTVRVPAAETTLEIAAGSTGYVVTDNPVNKAIVDAAAVGIRVANNDVIV